MRLKNVLKQISGSWYFFILMILVYAGLFLFNNAIFGNTIKIVTQILISIIPAIFIIFILMILSNIFISPEFILKHMGKNNYKKWLLVTIGGILSSGPIYMWYPFLANLKDKVLDDGMIACFLYNRAIKIPLLPIAVLYFSWQYVIVLSTVMVGASFLQGFIINKIMKIKI